MERDYYVKYHQSRAYADEQAEKYQRGEEVDGWAYETDPSSSPPMWVRLTGAAWVAHTYQMAAANASVLARTQAWWQSVVEKCKLLAADYRMQQQAGRKILKNDIIVTKPLTKHLSLRWDTQKKLLIITTRREQMRITPDEAAELLERLSECRDEIATALYKLPDEAIR